MVRFNRCDDRCPCKRDCAGRTPVCRKDCESYAKYAKIKAEEYARRISDYDASAFTPAKERGLRHKARDVRTGRNHVK